LRPACQQGLQRLDADAEHDRRLDVAQLLIVAQQDGIALPLRQLGEGGLDAGGDGGPLQVCPRRGCSARQLACGVERDLAASAQASWHRLSVTRWSHVENRASPARHLAACCQNAQEHLLRNVLGVGPVAEHPPCQRGDPRQMPVDERRTCGPVAGTGPTHEIEIGILDRSAGRSARTPIGPPRSLPAEPHHAVGAPA
jgi:hypothetical protein